MPIFSLAFGSFGDISLCIQLLWKIGKEVCDATGSSQEYQVLKAELVQTVAILNEILLLTKGPQTSQRTQIQLDNLVNEATGCHRSIQDFLRKRQQPRTFWQIASWHTLYTSDARELQELLSRQCTRLNMLLGMYNRSHQDDKDEYDNNRVSTTLTQVHNDVSQVHQEVVHTYGSIHKLSELMRAMEVEIKDMRQTDAKIVLIDPLNRRYDVPLNHCDTFTMMADMIHFYAKNMHLAGKSYIDRGDFQLVHGPTRKVLTTDTWVNEAGMRIEICILLRQQRKSQISCPRCQTTFQGDPSSKWSTCLACQGEFQLKEKVEITSPAVSQSQENQSGLEDISQFRLISVITEKALTAPVDIDKQCGVINDRGLPCSRPLICTEHSMGSQRAVEGRSRPYDELILNGSSRRYSLAERLKQLQGGGTPADLVGRPIPRLPSQNFRPQPPPVLVPSRQLVPIGSFGPPSPTSSSPKDRIQTPRVQKQAIRDTPIRSPSDFSRVFPSIDELDERS
ncbi:hypothetical protein FS842_002883 [Serendipita sp. 407]|nr:hypothetical protein FRC18_002048 [Serendipita sp. 400]KAG9055190.1 hypothetical protein FS842_002883 [Serendipita sp. 407]